MRQIIISSALLVASIPFAASGVPSMPGSSTPGMQANTSPAKHATHILQLSTPDESALLQRLKNSTPHQNETARKIAMRGEAGQQILMAH